MTTNRCRTSRTELLEEEIHDMIEFFMRETLDFDHISQESIFNNINKEIIKRQYIEIVDNLISKEKERWIDCFKTKVFEIIKTERPCSEEEVIYLMGEWRDSMPTLFMIDKVSFLNIWEMEYKEPHTGLKMTFEEWARLYNLFGQNSKHE
ncbi:MAG: hypothetical protein K2L45_12385 [Muribaculaceae bacterium]|nr:hypothetical protein [Muribaculaceae bacterium]